MNPLKRVYGSLFLLLLSLFISHCSGGDDEDSGGDEAPPQRVTLQGRVDDGLALSPIAHAQCHFTNLNGAQLATATADSHGVFSLAAPLDSQGWLVCTPVGLPNLALTAFTSTVGSVAGGTLPTKGLEEVSPSTTVIAEILAQTAPADLQARKAELVAALQSRDPELTALVEAATDLFNAMLQQPITAIDFSSTGSAESDDAGSGGGGGGSSEGDTDGAAGATGDGAELSPFVNRVVPQ
jgi:hypothetical protein